MEVIAIQTNVLVIMQKTLNSLSKPPVWDSLMLACSMPTDLL